MFESLDIMRLAQSFAAHAATRQQAIAQNVANSDTPGYRARDVVPFDQFLAATSSPRAQQAPPPRPDDLIRLDPDASAMSPNGNSVSIENEMMRGIAARQQHETALGIYSTSRDIMRAAIGR